MKRMLTLGALALGLALTSQQEASAWVNFKFGAGVNWHWQSGGNNFAWGLFHNGQIPGPEFFSGYPAAPGCAPGCAQGYLPNNFQYFGGQPGYPTQTNQPWYAGNQQQLPNTANTPQATPQAPNNNVSALPPNYYPATNYQPVSYNPQQYPAYYNGYNPYFYTPPNYYNMGFNVGH